jgi:hypothetical protein
MNLRVNIPNFYIYFHWKSLFTSRKTRGHESLLVVSPLWEQPRKIVRSLIQLTWWSNPLSDQHFYSWALSLPPAPRPGLKLLIWLFKVPLNPKQLQIQAWMSFSIHVGKGCLPRWTQNSFDSSKHKKLTGV